MKKINKKILIIIVPIILAVVAISSATYSLFVNEESADNPTSYTTGILSITATSKSDNLNLTNALPMSDEDGSKTEAYTFTVTNTGNLAYKFNIKLLSTSSNTFSSNYIKLKVDDSDITTLANCTNSIIKQDVILKAGQSIDITIHIWLSIDTPNTELGKTFTSQIVTDGQAYNQPKATQTISNLYTNATKTTVTNNSITYNYANIYDTNGGLMNDRLGSTSTSIDGGNVRYYGPNPNNYIYFNCDDYKNQSASTCELWRIIGTFKDIELADGTKKDLVKIVRNDSLGDFGWDDKYLFTEPDPDPSPVTPSPATASIGPISNEKFKSNIDGTQVIFLDAPNVPPTNSEKCKTIGYVYETSKNDWSTSTLQTLLLNGAYYNNQNKTDNATGINFNVDKTGLKNDITRNIIAEVTWNLGGYSGSNIYSNQMYEYERGTKNAVVAHMI